MAAPVAIGAFVAAQALREINALESRIAAAEDDANTKLWEQAALVVAQLNAGLSQRELARQWINVRTGEPYSQMHVSYTRQAVEKFTFHDARPRFRDAYNAVANATKAKRREPPAPPVLWKDLSDDERRELRRIAAEMRTFPFVTHTFTEQRGAGSTPTIVPGAAGAPVYWDIVGGNPDGGAPTYRYTRADVSEKLDAFLEGGPRCVVTDLAVTVARGRLTGDLFLSRPLLPPTDDTTVTLSRETVDACRLLAQRFKTTTLEATIAEAVAFTRYSYSLELDDEDDVEAPR